MIQHPTLGRNDMFYRSRTAQTVRVPGSQVDFAFLEGELVHVLPSHKVFFHKSHIERLINGVTR